eukprot:695385-Rhodomonas_salina.8
MTQCARGRDGVSLTCLLLCAGRSDECVAARSSRRERQARCVPGRAGAVHAPPMAQRHLMFGTG